MNIWKTDRICNECKTDTVPCFKLFIVTKKYKNMADGNVLRRNSNVYMDGERRFNMGYRLESYSEEKDVELKIPDGAEAGDPDFPKCLDCNGEIDHVEGKISYICSNARCKSEYYRPISSSS